VHQKALERKQVFIIFQIPTIVSDSHLGESWNLDYETTWYIAYVERKTDKKSKIIYIVLKPLSC